MQPLADKMRLTKINETQIKRVMDWYDEYKKIRQYP